MGVMNGKTNSKAILGEYHIDPLVKSVHFFREDISIEWAFREWDTWSLKEKKFAVVIK